jgi:hypothetical protein
MPTARVQLLVRRMLLLLNPSPSLCDVLCIRMVVRTKKGNLFVKKRNPHKRKYFDKSFSHEENILIN